MADNDDKTVKELIDAATRAELEKWFSLPSFQQLPAQEAAATAARPPSAQEEERAAYIKKVDAALAAVDPKMLEAHGRRVARLTAQRAFTAVIDTHIDPSIMKFDETMAEHAHTIAEPRTYEMPSDRDENLAEATPQALLRDLHRPELFFEKTFEVVDVAEQNRVDRNAIIAEALAFRRASLDRRESRFREARAMVLEVRKDRRRPWTELIQHMRNRRVKE